MWVASFNSPMGSDIIRGVSMVKGSAPLPRARHPPPAPPLPALHRHQRGDDTASATTSGSASDSHTTTAGNDAQPPAQQQERVQQADLQQPAGQQRDVPPSWQDGLALHGSGDGGGWVGWGGLPSRYKIVGATALAFVLCNMDKVNIR
jgi:hypothetical protein